MRKPFHRRGNHHYDQDDAFTMERIMIPHETAAFLKSVSEKTGITRSRLVAIAIDNERDQGPKAFNYPCEFSKEAYVEYAYADEAHKIFQFLEKFPTGTAKDTLMLCRRDIGIQSRERLMEGLRELIQNGVVEEFQSKQFGYVSKGMTRVRVCGIDPRELRRRKFKKIEGEPTHYQRSIKDDDIERDK